MVQVKRGNCTVQFSSYYTIKNSWLFKCQSQMYIECIFIHTATHKHTCTANCSATSCYSWSLLLISGLELSSQVFPGTKQKNKKPLDKTTHTKNVRIKEETEASLKQLIRGNPKISTQHYTFILE